MGYITNYIHLTYEKHWVVSKLFRAYGLYNISLEDVKEMLTEVSKLFRAYGLYNGRKR